MSNESFQSLALQAHLDAKRAYDRAILAHTEAERVAFAAPLTDKRLYTEALAAEARCQLAVSATRQAMLALEALVIPDNTNEKEHFLAVTTTNIVERHEIFAVEVTMKDQDLRPIVTILSPWHQTYEQAQVNAIAIAQALQATILREE